MPQHLFCTKFCTVEELLVACWNIRESSMTKDKLGINFSILG